MSIWDRFDYRAVSLFSANLERARTIQEEFARVGLENVIPFWSSPNPYLGTIEKNVLHCSLATGAFLACTLKNQQLVRAAYDSGARRGLFFEDDVRFLKDAATLGQIIEALPDDADIAMLDWLHRTKAPMSEYHEFKERAKSYRFWMPFSESLRSTGCYSLSRKGMKLYLDVLETPARDRGNKLKLSDQVFAWMIGQGLKGYCAIPCACTQRAPGGTSNPTFVAKRYDMAGMRRDMYA